MAERERRLTRPGRGRFRCPRGVMDPDDVRRALVRIAHEIIERNHGLDDVVLVGLQTGGRAARRARSPRRSRRSTATDGPARHARRRLLPRRHRPAARARPRRSPTSPSTSTGRVVVLVDDVLFTGRTVRAALDALTDYGRPRAVQLAVMVDRGPPGAADPPRLRRQEPADPPRRGWSTSTTTGSCSATSSGP